MIACNIICCAGSDSDGGSDEAEVPGSGLSDSSMRQLQSCASSVQVVSISNQLPQTSIYNHFILLTDFLSLLSTPSKLSFCMIPVVCFVYGFSVCTAVNGHSAHDILVEFPDIT